MKKLLLVLFSLLTITTYGQRNEHFLGYELTWDNENNMKRYVSRRIEIGFPNDSILLIRYDSSNNNYIGQIIAQREHELVNEIILDRIRNWGEVTNEWDADGYNVISISPNGRYISYLGFVNYLPYNPYDQGMALYLIDLEAGDDQIRTVCKNCAKSANWNDDNKLFVSNNGQIEEYDPEDHSFIDVKEKFYLSNIKVSVDEIINIKDYSHQEGKERHIRQTFDLSDLEMLYYNRTNNYMFLIITNFRMSRESRVEVSVEANLIYDLSNGELTVKWYRLNDNSLAYLNKKIDVRR